MFDTPQESPAAKPVRPGRRIVRTGVVVGITGFVITAAGAIMLGQGPGPLEVPGNVIHRVGMTGMLGGFLIVLLGYRWPQIRSLIATFSDIAMPEVSSMKRSELNQLVDQVGPDVAAHRESASPVYVTAEAIPPVVPDVVASSSHPVPGEAGQSSASPHQTFPSQPTFHQAAQIGATRTRSSREPKRGGSIGAGNTTLLIVGWTLVGVTTFLGVLIFFLGSPGLSLLVTVLAELALATTLLVIIVHGRGALRTFAIGAVIPVIMMLLAVGMFVAPLALLGSGMGGMWGPYGMPGGPWRSGMDEFLYRSIRLLFQLFLIGACGTFALFIRMTMTVFERRQGPGEP